MAKCLNCGYEGELFADHKCEKWKWDIRSLVVESGTILEVPEGWEPFAVTELVSRENYKYTLTVWIRKKL